MCGLCVYDQTRMSLQLYQVDQKSYLLDFKSLNTLDHPDADRVKRMTRASMTSAASDQMNGEITLVVCVWIWRRQNSYPDFDPLGIWAHDLLIIKSSCDL